MEISFNKLLSNKIYDFLGKNLSQLWTCLKFILNPTMPTKIFHTFENLTKYPMEKSPWTLRTKMSVQLLALASNNTEKSKYFPPLNCFVAARTQKHDAKRLHCFKAIVENSDNFMSVSYRGELSLSKRHNNNELS